MDISLLLQCFYLPRAGKDAGRPGLRFVWAHNGRKDGRVRRQLHATRRELRHAGQGEQVGGENSRSTRDGVASMQFILLPVSEPRPYLPHVP